MERKADFSDLVGHWTPDPAFDEIVDRATDVFVVERVHAIAENQEEVKIIGVYSSRAAAEDAIERLKLKPGACDSHDGFVINPFGLDRDP